MSDRGGWRKGSPILPHDKEIWEKVQKRAVEFRKGLYLLSNGFAASPLGISRPLGMFSQYIRSPMVFKTSSRSQSSSIRPVRGSRAMPLRLTIAKTFPFWINWRLRQSSCLRWNIARHFRAPNFPRSTPPYPSVHLDRVEWYLTIGS